MLFLRPAARLSSLMKDIKITKLENSEVEIEGELPSADFNKFRPAALEALNKEMKIDGFRTGHIPENILVSHLGEERVLLEMAERAIAEHYPSLVKENKIDALGRPEITLTKLAKDNPLGFKIKTAVHPEFTLPDYKKIATEVNTAPTDPIEVGDKEIDEVIEEVRKARTNPETKEMPELNDEFAKSLGNFETVEALKNKIKENLQHEKEHKARDKKRVSLMDKLAEATEIKIPNVLIESELEKMVAELRGQIDQMRLKFEDYLAHIKKTEEELKEGWRGDAEKRVKTSLILGKIAEQEKITPSEDEINKEVAHLKQHYPEANDLRLKMYVVGVLINDKTLEFLEKQK